MIAKFKFIQDNGYSIKDPKSYIGYSFDPMVDKINELIKVINKQEIKIKKLEKKIKNMNKENLFIIGVGLCGGFGGIHTYEVIEADSLEEAEKLAYEASCENYEQYEGLYGLRTVNDIIEEDKVNEEEAEEIYIEERESWLNYIAYSWSKELEDDLKSKYHYTNNLNN